jgi:hypothetical protein
MLARIGSAEPPVQNQHDIGFSPIVRQPDILAGAIALSKIRRTCGFLFIYHINSLTIPVVSLY